MFWGKKKTSIALGLGLFFAVGLLFFAPHKVFAATFSVDSTADSSDSSPGDGNCDNGSGACTLRAAIEETNALSGADTINFNISGAGVHTITLGSDLPYITDQVTIDGTSQSGASCGTLVPNSLPAVSNTPHSLLIEINAGDNYTPFVFYNSANNSNSTLRGLIINHSFVGVVIDGSAGGGDNITVECNYIGTNSDGSASASPNSEAMEIDSADSAMVQNNLISGNQQGAIWVQDATNPTFQNNIIGLNAAGTSIIGNLYDGITVHFASTTTTNTTITHNIISGNDENGIRLDSNDTVTISSNYIGLTLAGAAAGNTDSGIDTGGSSNLTIGGTNASDGNYISANSLNGIYLSSSSTLIQNNTIGLTGNGNSVAGNTESGIYEQDGLNANSFIDNYIGGNQANGLRFNGYDDVITGNHIGLSHSGDPVGNGAEGILAEGASGFVIGGASESLRNFIADNGSNGIHIHSDCSTGYINGGNIKGNYIGTNEAGDATSGYGNHQSGVVVNEQTGACGSIFNIQIGGTESGESNTIAGNTVDGIRVFQGPNSDVFSVIILVNSIFDNGNLGINLAHDASDAGTADEDLGPNAINSLAITYPAGNANYYINRPTINSALSSGSNITVNYDFHANSITESDDSYALLPSDLVGYRLDFYIADAKTDGAYSGYAQGKTHIGSFIVDGSETNASHTFTSPITLQDGQVVTATATVLWTTSPGDSSVDNCGNYARQGTSPPYSSIGGCT